MVLGVDIGDQAAADVWCRAGAGGVIIAGRRVEKLEEVAQGLRRKYPSPRILAVRADVTVQSDMEELFGRVKEEFGRSTDVLLANAGVMEKHNLIADQDADAWWNSMVCFGRYSELGLTVPRLSV